jgi:hypothetical protein
MSEPDASLDERVLRALAKWPDVPDCFGWLALDQRGRWRVQGQIISHPRAVDFISRNYRGDEFGRWSFQNGPQRVFVDLEYTPWVYRFDGSGALKTHTGLAVQGLRRLLIDESGTLLVDAGSGIGVLHDADLLAVIARLVNAGGNPLDDGTIEAELSRLAETGASALRFDLAEDRVPVARIESQQVPGQFNFVQHPQ